jgi:hypothetical protein
MNLIYTPGLDPGSIPGYSPLGYDNWLLIRWHFYHNYFETLEKVNSVINGITLKFNILKDKLKKKQYYGPGEMRKKYGNIPERKNM